jgi:malonyl-CoA/methylmalonyl-CoA synthetase
MLQIIENARQYTHHIAIVSDQKEHSFGVLLQESEQFAGLLLNHTADLAEARVAFMVSPGFDYVRVQWAIWQAGGVAVPLCVTHPFESLKYIIDDTEASVVVVSPQYESVLASYTASKNIRFMVLEATKTAQTVALPAIEASRKAMILYTSGTTNLPKGVVSTHTNLEAQISTLIAAWEWSSEDRTVCILPLHHVHGIVNVVSCALWAGACVEFMDFVPKQLFEVFLIEKITVFMAVPTIYFKLIAYFETLPAAQQTALLAAMQKFRLMVSGSAALPVSVMEKWAHISGHRLLERYGMTEIGMALSNPYRGARLAGHVGVPLPNVKVRLVDEHHKFVVSGQPGEIQVKGPNVFQEYWHNPQATTDSFTTDGWFKTGDIAVWENNSYKILGRDSVDIIKSGGYKISALEIEEVLRTYPNVKDCGVVGIPNEEWGELVVAVLVTEGTIDETAIHTWIREKMPAYRVPRQYKIIPELPRNTMGKVTKNDLKKLF